MLDANQAHITLTIPAVETDLQVLSFIGREMLNKPYRFEIDLVSPRANLNIHALINQPAYLAIGRQSANAHGYSSADQVVQWANLCAVLGVNFPQSTRAPSLSANTRRSAATP